jgi:UrcA family protein
MRVSTPILAAALMLATLSFGAHADTSTDDAGTIIRGSSVVYYGDLNIDTEQDAKILLQRIERAAKKAWGGTLLLVPIPDYWTTVLRNYSTHWSIGLSCAPLVSIMA